MNIYTLENKDTLYNFIDQELRNIGIKQPLKVKKNTTKKTVHSRTRIFQRPLDHLPRQPVQLQCGAVVDVPCFLVDLCQALDQHLETEGLFRKAGSAVRQKEIKAHIEAGGGVSNDFHEVDVANILKLFLRELPEPLLPIQYHDILVRCRTQSVEHLLLACLLLPPNHLNFLAYLLEFLHRVASKSNMNLMPASNLAIVLAPALMPMPDHRSSSSKLSNQAVQHDHYIQVLQALIDNASHFGEVPLPVAVQLGLLPVQEAKDEVDRASLGSNLDNSVQERRGRKRRSGSLTRVLNGLRKMVSGRPSSPLDDAGPEPHTPGQISPCIKSAAKKMRTETPGCGLSAKKKLEVLRILPESTVLTSTPAKFCMQTLHMSDTPVQACFFSTPPVCCHPNPQKSVTKSPHPQVLKNKQRNRFFTPKSRSESLLQRVIDQPEQKKQRLSFGLKKSTKNKQMPAKTDVDPPGKSRQLPKCKKSWSSLGGSWGRSMRRLAPVVSIGTPLLASPYAVRPGGVEICQGLGGATAAVDLSPGASPMLHLHSEYEEIRNKVSNLENQLNEELSKAQQETSDAHIASFVQSAYERTLEDSEKFSNCQSTEKLAKRLSRELKIRRSGENKVIRSPSARKIGTLRRRSRESNRQLVRTSSLDKMMRSPIRSTVPLQHPRSLRRGRPNTLLSGLPSPAVLHKSVSSSAQSLMISDMTANETVSKNDNKFEAFIVPQSPFVGSTSKCNVQKSSSFRMTKGKETLGEEIKKASSFGNIMNAEHGEEKWHNANDFFSTATPSKCPSTVGRPSIAEIKRKRAGMVLASVKLFNNRTSISPETKQGCKTSISATEIKSPVVSKLKGSFHSQLNTTNSPKKMGSPRRQSSSKTILQHQNKKIMKTPTDKLVKSINRTPHSDGIKHKSSVTPKHSNVKTKVNSSLPGNWLSEKENVFSPTSPFYLPSLKTNISPQIKLPDGLKDTIYAVCTPRSQLLKSPLCVKDCNKMLFSTMPSTPQQCPLIKKPLSVKPIVASALRRTPHSLLETPSKTPKPMHATPLRRSPRLMTMNAYYTPCS